MQFTYQVKASTGEMFEGTIEAPGESVAVEILQSRGYTVLALNQVGKNLLSLDLNQFISRPNNKDIVMFTRQLATLVEADMPLAEGLRTLAKQMEKASFRKIIADVSDAVEGGSSLSAALAEYPKLFSSFYVKLVRSGELSGKLHDSLMYLADYLERSQAISSKITGALAYPAFVVFAMVIVTMILMIYVLPQLLAIFKESGFTDLPITTKILIGTTNFFNSHIFFILAVVIGGSVALWRYIRTPKGKQWLDNVKIRAPVFGRILRNLYLARMAESLATLIKSGISILDGLRITSDLIDNHNFQQLLLEAEESVRGGGTISETFAKYKEVPPLMTSMVAIGERTGKLDYMLGHISKFYHSESENDIQNLSQLIEPILVLVLGAGVAVLVSSILLPIYSLVGAG